MSKITIKCRDNVINILSKELDTRDKRFMFLKCQFSRLTSRINLEGSAYQCGCEIYYEFERQKMIDSLIASLNMIFESDLYLEIKK